jgi:hypothetical protein
MMYQFFSLGLLSGRRLRIPAKGYDRRKQKICLSSSVDAPRRSAPYSNAVIVGLGVYLVHEDARVWYIRMLI